MKKEEMQMRNTRRQNQEKIIKRSNYYFFGWTSSSCWGQAMFIFKVTFYQPQK